MILLSRFATAGYSNFGEVLVALDAWCQANDKRHGAEGWILMTQGDGDYGHESIETLASVVAARGTPTVFLQSDFGFCEPGDHLQSSPHAAPTACLLQGLHTGQHTRLRVFSVLGSGI